MTRFPVSSARERGFTLTEIAIVLGIIGTILGAIWVASARVSQSNKAQKAASQVMLILSGYQSLYTQRPVTNACWTNNNAVGLNSGFFPADMLVNGAPTNQWGGAVNVYDCGPSWNGIIIEYTGLTPTACNVFADALAQSPALQWEGMGSTAGSSTVSNGTPGQLLGSNAWTPATIASYCNSYSVVQLMFPAQ